MKYLNDDKIQQQIEAYLNQEMSALERTRFEKQIHEDADLHEEIEVQESLREAIRAERILQLKTSLNSLNVSLWSAGLMQTAKIAALVAGMGIAGGLGYYYYSQSNKPLPARLPSVNQPVAQAEKNPLASVPQTTEEATPEVAEPQAREPEVRNSETTSSGKVEASVSPRKNIPQKRDVSSSHADLPVAVGEAELSEPGMKQVNPASARDISLPTDGITDRNAPESVHPEVVIKRDNKEKFHYQFVDSKLVLYADFSDKLYEVLELNQNNQKKLFFAYDGRFFALDPMKTEITPLREVQDKNLIQVLAGYQKRRN